MAKNSIRDYSATNSSNTDIQSIDISEGCSPAGINNAIREVMADLKDVSTGTIALESPSADSLTVTGDLTVDTTTLKVDSTNNRVGIGTALPSSFYSLANNLVVGTGSGGNGMTIYSGSGDSGYIGFNDTASASMQGFIQYNHNGDYMAFAPNGSEKMRIDSSGALLVNTTGRFGTANFVVAADAVTANPISVVNTKTTASTDYAILFYRVNSIVGSIQTSLSATSYLTSSDYRLKTAVTYDWDATSRLKQLKPARFKWIAEGDDAVFVDGFLAHEVEDIVPESISGTKDGMRDEEYEVTPAVLDDDGNEVTPAVMGTRSVPDYQGIDQSKLTPLLTKALIEAVEKIEQLEARITALETA